jgi:hypothetical protein
MEPIRFHFTRSTLALSIKAVAVLGAIIAIYFQDLTIIFSDALQSEITNCMLAIPIIFTYLIYRKRKMLRAVIPLENPNQPKQTKCIPAMVGLLLCTAAITFYWYGSYTFTPLEHHMVTLPIFVAGLTLILFNPQTLRQLAFPIAFRALYELDNKQEKTEKRRINLGNTILNKSRN